MKMQNSRHLKNLQESQNKSGNEKLHEACGVAGFYTDKEYLRVMNEFKRRNVPFTVATIDMDWHYSDTKEIDEKYHITENNLTGKEYVGDIVAGWNYGWTGYSWNERLFPDYKKFLRQLKERGFKVTLNLHPADGVRFWETQYMQMAQAVGIDPASKHYVPFRVDDDKYINAYFSVLLKPYENDGVEFWWIDWQQGEKSDTEGLDPLWALNHYHYYDAKSNHARPIILSRYAGIGSHRYPLGFSGDTYISWDTLAYLPYFTLTASNIGYTWWSHDIGGHMMGEKDDELFVRQTSMRACLSGWAQVLLQRASSLCLMRAQIQCEAKVRLKACRF